MHFNENKFIPGFWLIDKIAIIDDTARRDRISFQATIFHFDKNWEAINSGLWVKTIQWKKTQNKLKFRGQQLNTKWVDIHFNDALNANLMWKLVI